LTGKERSQKCGISRSFAKIRVWREKREIHLYSSCRKSCRVSSVIWLGLENWQKGGLLRLQLEKFSPALVLLFCVSREYPNLKQGAAGKQVVWGKGVQ